MKRFIKYVSLIPLCALIALTLTSCFTSPAQYTEWELSGYESEISDGNTVYTVYQNGDFLEHWSLGHNGEYIYANEAESKITDNYASIYSPLAERNILAAQIYESDFGAYVATQLYVVGTGKATLDGIGMPALDTECYARDSKSNLRGKVTEELVTLISTFEATSNRTQKSYGDLYSLECIEIYDEALDGFFTSVIGGFYFDRTDVLYVKGEINQQTNTYSAVVLSENQRAALASFINNEITEFRHLNIVYEKPIADTNTDGQFTAVARVILLVTVFTLGILMPLIPITLSLVLLKRRNWRFKVTDYILLISSGVWLLSGIIVFIILLF